MFAVIFIIIVAVTSIVSAANICRNRSSQSDYVRDDKDPRTFFICLAGEVLHLSCDIGQSFDPYNGLCIFDLNANERSNNVNESENDKSEDDNEFYKKKTTTTMTTKTTTEISTILPILTTIAPLFVCPKDTSNIFFSHPTNCSQFYICVSGNATLGNCPGGLFFDEALQGCIPAEMVDCSRDKE